MQPSDTVRLLEDLVERHYALLYRYAYRLSGSTADAEDLTQHAFLTAHAKIAQLRDPSSAKSWLCAIVRNAYLKDRRGPGRVVAALLDNLAAPLESPTDPDFDEHQLQAALNELPEEFRSPLILFYFEEFSYKEIAEQMNVPLGTIMSRLSRARALLRRKLTTNQGPRELPVVEPAPACPPSSDPIARPQWIA